MPLRHASILFVFLAIGAIGVAVIGHFGREQHPPLPSGFLTSRIVVDKVRHTMTLYDGNLPLRTCAVALGRGGLEAKTRQGDKKTPEGHYRIDSRNLHSAYHLALHISYPDAEDIAKSTARGEKPGGDIMIHGIRNGFGWVGALHRWADWTAGCVAVTNEEIEEIWRVAPNGTPVNILP